MVTIAQQTFHKVWDCEYCGTQDLSAFNCKQCPNCGKPLGKNRTRRTRTVIENYQFSGHDVICGHCNVRNEKRFSCRGCGASLIDGDDERVKSFTFKTDADYEQLAQNNGENPVTTARATNRSGLSSTLGTTSGGNNRAWWIVGSVVAAVIVSAIFWIVSQLNAVIPVTLTADRAHWAYYLALEDYRPRSKNMTVEDGSFDSLPNDAYNIDRIRVFIRSEPVYNTRTVSRECTSTSGRDNGDGSWTESVSTYDCSYTEQVQVGSEDIWGTRYDYTVDRWESIAPLTKEGWGQITQFPVFTTASACLGQRPTHGCQRAPNEPRLTFTIHFFYYKDGDEVRHDVEREMGRDVWEAIHLGENYPAVLNGFGGIRAIQGIDPAYEKLIAD